VWGFAVFLTEWRWSLPSISFFNHSSIFLLPPDHHSLSLLLHCSKVLFNSLLHFSNSYFEWCSPVLKYARIYGGENRGYT